MILENVEVERKRVRSFSFNGEVEGRPQAAFNMRKT